MKKRSHRTKEEEVGLNTCSSARQGRMDPAIDESICQTQMLLFRS